MGLRIERMRFAPWGCFEDHTLTFSPRPGDVDLIHGLNASGKSTTSRGERSLLYGIEERTRDNHTYDYADLCIDARLQLNGTSMEISRRKRRVGSLLGPDGEPLAEDVILPALGGLTEEVYRALFQVDHETLVRGGAELLQGEGEIGASLFAAAAGIATLHGTLGDLEGEAQRLFNPRGRTSALHKALSDLRSAEKRTRDGTLRPAHHRAMTRELLKAEEECDTLSEQMRDLEVRVRAIDRRRAIAPLLDARTERLAELENLAGTPDLPDSAATQRSAAQARVHAGSAALQRVRERAEKLEEEIDAIDVDETLLMRAGEIRATKESVSAISKAAGDRRKRDSELHAARADLKNAAATAGVTSGEIESLRRPASARRALDRYLSERDELTSRRMSAQARMDETERARDQAQMTLDGVPIAADVRALDAAITAALKVGSVHEQIELSRAEAELRRREATERLARLHPAPSSIDDLRMLPAISRERAERAANESKEVKHIAETIASDATRLASAENELAEDRERLAAAGEAPTAEALASARDLRDEEWSAVRAATGNGSPLEHEDADRFERSLADADHVADARTDHAAQIERSAAVQARTTRLKRERRQLNEREARLQERQVALASEWSQAWARTGLTSIDPEDASAWLAERETILGLVHAADEAHARAHTLAERERGHADELSQQLSLQGHETALDVPLQTLIARAQGVVQDAREQATERSAAEAALLSADRAVAGAEREREAADAAWSAWENTWPDRRAEAGIPETATPEAAQEVARAVDDALGHLERISDLERRIVGIDNDRAEFEAHVRSLCNEVAPELSALELERSVSALHAKADEHDRRRTRRDGLTEQRTAVEIELNTTQRDLEAAQAEIELALAAADCDDVSGLPEIEARASRARILRSEITEIEQQVAHVGEGQLSELLDDAAEFDRDGAAQELAELRERAEELREQRDGLKERIGEQKRELHEAETDTAPVQAAQDVELARAAVEEAAIAYAKAKLSATVVWRAIDRYRRLHQGPLLHRANELFKRLTLGSFVELFVDLERGESVLIGRQRDRVLKRVPEMSKGTREQLFLALRIAAIERYVSTSGPVPVIFDDVFIESDLPRSERIFGALGELATKTQVIVLTHHDHLIEVGRRALRDKLVVQDLPDAAPTLREAAAA
jgi:uncharacterized protein YhaN